MIDSLEAALEQNHKLVDEIYNSNMDLKNAQKRIAELEKTLKVAAQNPFMSDEDVFKKLASAEAKIKNLEESNMIMFRQSKKILAEKEEAEKKAQAYQEQLESTTQRYYDTASQLEKIKAINRSGTTQEDFKRVEELETQLKNKEIQLAMATTEICEKDKILQDMESKIVQLNQNQKKLFENSEALVKIASATENALKVQLDSKEQELNAAKKTNYDLAENWNALGAKCKELESENYNLKMQLVLVANKFGHAGNSMPAQAAATVTQPALAQLLEQMKLHMNNGTKET